MPRFSPCGAISMSCHDEVLLGPLPPLLPSLFENAEFRNDKLQGLGWAREAITHEQIHFSFPGATGKYENCKTKTNSTPPPFVILLSCFSNFCLPIV
jgi:hypothetical protein